MSGREAAEKQDGARGRRAGWDREAAPASESGNPVRAASATLTQPEAAAPQRTADESAGGATLDGGGGHLELGDAFSDR